MQRGWLRQPCKIYLSSIEHRAVLWHWARAANTRTICSLASVRRCRATARSAPVTPVWQMLTCALCCLIAQPHEGPATIGLSEADATGRLVIGGRAKGSEVELGPEKVTATKSGESGKRAYQRITYYTQV